MRALLISLLACRSPSKPPTVRDDAAIADAAAPAALAVDAAVGPVGPAPYPEDWIHLAELDNSQLSCAGLVYKRGCSELRRGTIKFRVTLGATGAVDRVEIVDNTVNPEPDVVARCVKTKLPQWKFKPPVGAPTFEMKLVLADKC